MLSGLPAVIPGFAGPAQPWGRLGLWLSLWDDAGQPLIGLPDPPAFWQLLRVGSGRFQKLLREAAHRGLEAARPTWTELEPHSGILVLCLPIHHRQRAAGAVLGCAVTDGFLDDENLARFCSLHQLDRQMCERLAGEIQHHSTQTLGCFAEILSAQIESLSGQAIAARDVHDLSSHLAQAYEELNLIYRVSSNLTVLKRPAIHFQEVCAELLAVSVVQGFAAVLEAEPGPASLGEQQSAPGTQPATPTVLRVGPVVAREDEIIRLYQEVRGCEPNAGTALVINNVADFPQFAWASAWLNQFVYFELKRHETSYGGLLALNHVDSVDFGSQETQLVSAVTERSASFLENVHLYDNLEQLFMGMLHALVSSIDAKDPYTSGHSQRVAWLSRHLADRLGWPEERCRRVYLSGLLHDVGKIGISEHVLRKTGPLTEPEFNEMKRHPEIGARILQGVRQIQDVIPGVLEHHERYDGLGYPNGLRGEEISTLGRIIALADSFDAMTTSRTYRTAHPVQIAVAEIRRWSGTQFDPYLVDLLLRDDAARLLEVMTNCEQQPLVRYEGLAPRPRMPDSAESGTAPDGPPRGREAAGEERS